VKIEGRRGGEDGVSNNFKLCRFLVNVREDFSAFGSGAECLFDSMRLCQGTLLN